MISDQQLLSLAANGAGIDALVLQTCRTEILGQEAYGREATRSLLRRAQINWTSDPVVARAASFAVMIGETSAGIGAMAVDLDGDWISRIWGLSAAFALATVPRVDVPGDLDLHQTAHRIRLSASSLPDLQEQDRAPLTKALATLLDDPPQSWSSWRRTRLTVIRAASTPVGAVALARLTGETGDTEAGAGCWVAVLTCASGTLATDIPPCAGPRLPAGLIPAFQDRPAET